MADIIDFKPKKKKTFNNHMLTLDIYQDQDEMLEVACEIGEGYSDYEVFEALVGAAMKFAEDNDIVLQNDASITLVDDTVH